VIHEYCTNCSGYTGWSFGHVYFNGALTAEYGGSTYFVTALPASRSNDTAL
jgi:hypothetical protein